MKRLLLFLCCLMFTGCVRREIVYVYVPSTAIVSEGSGAGISIRTTHTELIDFNYNAYLEWWECNGYDYHPQLDYTIVTASFELKRCDDLKRIK